MFGEKENGLIVKVFIDNRFQLLKRNLLIHPLQDDNIYVKIWRIKGNVRDE